MPWIQVLYTSFIAHDKCCVMVWRSDITSPEPLYKIQYTIICSTLIYNHMHDHWETPYMDISIRHHKSEDRTWDCLSHSDSPAGKAPHQYSEDHQEKWAQSLAHILHCDMQRDLWIEFRICNVQSCNIFLQNGGFSTGYCINEKKVHWSIQAKHPQKDFQFQAVNRNPLCIYSITWRPSGMHIF